MDKRQVLSKPLSIYLENDMVFEMYDKAFKNTAKFNAEKNKERYLRDKKDKAEKLYFDSGETVCYWCGAPFSIHEGYDVNTQGKRICKGFCRKKIF